MSLWVTKSRKERDHDDGGCAFPSVLGDAELVRILLRKITTTANMLHGVGGRRNEHVSVGGRHVSEKGGHVSDKVMEELERTAEYYTSYFRCG
eukprot:843352-Amorphochlora_amoeboformis.AAC.1